MGDNNESQTLSNYQRTHIRLGILGQSILPCGQSISLGLGENEAACDASKLMVRPTRTSGPWWGSLTNAKHNPNPRMR